VWSCLGVNKLGHRKPALCIWSVWLFRNGASTSNQFQVVPFLLLNRFIENIYTFYNQLVRIFLTVSPWIFGLIKQQWCIIVPFSTPLWYSSFTEFYGVFINSVKTHIQEATLMFDFFCERLLCIICNGSSTKILLHSVFLAAGQLANELADDNINRTEGGSSWLAIAFAS
jgi:hypothetical protein